MKRSQIIKANHVNSQSNIYVGLNALHNVETPKHINEGYGFGGEGKGRGAPTREAFITRESYILT